MYNSDNVKSSTLNESRGSNGENSVGCRELLNRYIMAQESNNRDCNNLASKKMKVSNDSHQNGHIYTNYSEKHENNHENGIIDGEKKCHDPMTPLDFNTVSRNKIASSSQNNCGYLLSTDCKITPNVVNNDQENSNSFYDYINAVNKPNQQQFNAQPKGQENYSPSSSFDDSHNNTNHNHYSNSNSNYSNQFLSEYTRIVPGSESRPECSFLGENETTTSNADDSTSSIKANKYNSTRVDSCSNSISPTTRDGSFDGSLSTDSDPDITINQSSNQNIITDITSSREKRYQETLNFLNENDLIGVTLKTADLLKRNQLLQKEIDYLKNEISKFNPLAAI